MTYSKDLKPKGEGGTLYTSRDLAAMQAEINALKAATAQLENQLADMADLTNTTVLRANAVQTHDISANLAVFGTAVVEGELAVSNGSGQDKDVLVNRNGVPEWGTPTDINAVNVLVTNTVERATTVDHTGTVNEAESVTNVDQCDTVGETQKVTQGNAVTHADLVQVADVIQQTGDAQIVGDLDVTGTITQAGLTLDNTYIPQAEKGTANGVATLDNTGRVPASQLTIDAMEYKGKWNASTNTPALADGTGTDGDFYIVSVAGTQDLGSGNIDFYVNDRVLYNGSAWERVPAGQVDSVNGATGDVVLTGEDIAESTSDNLKIDRRLKNWLFVDGQGANATKTARGYFSADGIALITFDTNNVYQDAFSLTINSVTCQVYLNGAPTSSTNYYLPKGTYIVKAGIIGLTPYYTIETSACVLSARKALEIESSKLSSCGLLDLIYPVGSLYWSSKATSPDTLFGGTWTRIKDKFLWAMGDTDTVKATGGAKTVSLTSDNLPAHKHNFSATATTGAAIPSASGVSQLLGTFSYKGIEGVSASGICEVNTASWNYGHSGTSGQKAGTLTIDAKHTHSVTASGTTSNNTTSHTDVDKMPPYICMYCWERTA